MIRIAAAILVCWIACVAAKADGTIVLRSTTRVPLHSPVTVGDAALLTGEDAQKLAGLILIPASETSTPGTRKVGIGALRETLKGAGVNLGRLALSGSACTVRVESPRDEVETPAGAAPVNPPAAGPARDGTVETFVAQRIAEHLGVQRGDLKLTFDPRQRALLDTPGEGRSVVVQPTGDGERMTLSVRVLDSDRTVASGSVRVGVAVRRDATVAVQTIERGQGVPPGAVAVENRWLPPSTRPVSPAEAVGAAARSRIEPGTVIEARHIQPLTVIKKGDLVKVDVVSGDVVVRGEARALEAGREGDIISFESVYSRKRLRARVDGPGRAVSVVSEASNPSSEAEPPEKP